MTQVNKSISHDVIRGRVPEPHEGNEAQNDTHRLAHNVRHFPTGPTGYVDPEYFTEATPASSYNQHWDTGFAQEGDPYGIQAEYVAQSANPDAAG